MPATAALARFLRRINDSSSYKRIVKTNDMSIKRWKMPNYKFVFANKQLYREWIEQSSREQKKKLWKLPYIESERSQISDFN